MSGILCNIATMCGMKLERCRCGCVQCIGLRCHSATRRSEVATRLNLKLPTPSENYSRRIEMTKKLSVVTLSLFVAALFTTSAFAANNCSGGTNPVFIGVGSSAQTNSLAYAAVNITTAGTFTGY